jgi:hypothetical protein
VLAASATIGANHHAGETADLFNVEVEQIAGSSMFVANQGHNRFQIAHAVRTQAAENAAHGGPAQAPSLCNMLASKALAAQLFYVLRS